MPPIFPVSFLGTLMPIQTRLQFTCVPSAKFALKLPLVALALMYFERCQPPLAFLFLNEAYGLYLLLGKLKPPNVADA
jgi:hypothetical protein